jgi:CRISPR-associated protein Csb1
MTTNLSLDDLRHAVRDGAAIRRTARLQPAGGVGDKIFPPTYEGGTYALESRVVDGVRVPCVILDSVQSQANRMETCLLDAHRAERIAIPVITVDFGKAGLPEVGLISSLDAPHRLADAILRDSTHGGKSFRESE